MIEVEFCTEWPKGLETDEQCDAHFPMTVITSDYVLDRPTPRDARARQVSIQVHSNNHVKDLYSSVLLCMVKMFISVQTKL